MTFCFFGSGWEEEEEEEEDDEELSLSQLRFGFGGIYVSITCACVRCVYPVVWCHTCVETL